MKRLHTFFSILGLAAATSVTLVGCGGDDTTCGTGTVLMGDTCVPTTSCGTGTTLTDGECVPDGSVICEQGTRFDTATGTCVVDPSACADGTVLVGGECVPEDDTLTADHDEAAEPNDATGAGQFDVPAMNAMTTIHGCITPRAGAADEDVWIMQAAGPALIEVTADGVGGLAAAFIVQDNGIATLPTYTRFGINLTGDTSKRQVYLPVAGTYLLVMDDSRVILAGTPTGSADTCYYGTIQQLPLPAATPATFPATTGTDSGNVRVVSYTADAIGDIFDVTQTTTSTSMVPAFVVRKNGVFVGAPTYDQDNDFPPFWTVGGLAATDTVDVIVDEVYNLALTPQPYSLDLFDIAAQALPIDGSVVTVTKQNDNFPTAPWWENNYLYFDVATAGQVVHFNLTSSAAVSMHILRPDIFTPAGAFDAVATINNTVAGTTTFSNQLVRFRQPGRYYFVALDSAGMSGQTYTLTATVTDVSTTPITYGTPLTAQALPATGSSFHSLDLSGTTWIQASVPTVANWGGTARITLYDLAGEGWLNNNYAPVQTATVAVDGSSFTQRITLGDARDYLVRVEATAAVGTGPIYSLDIKERPHAVLGALTTTMPITRTGMDDLAAGASKGFLVSGAAGDAMFAQVTPTVATVDISAARRAIDGAVIGSVINGGGPGAVENISGSFVAMPAFQAFTVANTSATENTNLSFNITAPTPRMYTVTTGALAFADACAGGTTVMTGADDLLSAALTLPGAFSAFPLLGLPAGAGVKVSSNGWITFDTAASGSSASNATIPTAAAPGALVAPYWDDLTNITVCRKDDAVANTVTFQWEGNIYDRDTETAQFQAVLHSNGVIDFIYGANQVLDGSQVPDFGSNGATVGVENLAGTFGQQLLFNTTGILPSTSRTLTPL